MTYRDDHDAALARVHALEQALEQERSEDDTREARIVDLEQELRDERAKLARAEAELAKLRPTPSVERPPLSANHLIAVTIVYGVPIVVVLTIALGIAISLLK